MNIEHYYILPTVNHKFFQEDAASSSDDEEVL